MAQYILSDIHGCNRTFKAMLDQLAFSTADELYLLGDYVDRGPDSKGVIDTIWQLQRDGYNVHCLMGNHEEITISDFDAEFKKGWQGMGEPHLLKSFGVDRILDIPVAYIDWMRQLPTIHEVPGAILVHAGLDFNYADPLHLNQNMRWIRDWYSRINYDWLGDRIIVHGHTPVEKSTTLKMLEQLDQYRVLDIDTGCVFQRVAERFGYLCCFDLTNRSLVFHKNVEDDM
jgi:serine/threonine protein phosphatase 1